MEKPVWRRRSSTYVVDTPFMRLRRDEIELPDGTVINDYFVRESSGFVVVFALTPDRRVVLVRQYRYAADALGLELPAGTLDAGEDPLACAQREFAEETGYQAEDWEQIGTFTAEPVRSTALAYVYLARGARATSPQRLDLTEHIEVELADLRDVRAMLRDGRLDAIASVAAAYVALDVIDARA